MLGVKSEMRPLKERFHARRAVHTAVHPRGIVEVVGVAETLKWPDGKSREYHFHLRTSQNAQSDASPGADL